jgi:hypothetical protein
MNRHAHARDAGRVCHGQVVTRLHRDLAHHLDLAAEVHEEGAVGDVQHRDAFDGAQALDDLLAVTLVARIEAEVTGNGALADFHEVDGADVAAALADRGRDLAEHAGLILDL